MKRLFVFVIVVTLVLMGCGKEKAASELSYEQERQALLNSWEEIYRTKSHGDGYLEIVHARVIHIKETENEYFRDVDHIVEFVIFSDFYGSAPYYDNTGTFDTVVVYQDGRMETPSASLIDAYRGMTYQTDYSDFVDRVEDLGTAYNGVYDLTD